MIFDVILSAVCKKVIVKLKIKAKYQKCEYLNRSNDKFDIFISKSRVPYWNRTVLS